MADLVLQREFEYFKAHQDALVTQYVNKFIVIKDQAVAGAYESQLAAYEDAKRKFPAGTFLIQHCVPGTESYTQTFHSRVAAH